MPLFLYCRSSERARYISRAKTVPRETGIEFPTRRSTSLWLVKWRLIAELQEPYAQSCSPNSRVLVLEMRRSSLTSLR